MSSEELLLRENAPALRGGVRHCRTPILAGTRHWSSPAPSSPAFCLATIALSMTFDIEAATLPPAPGIAAAALSSAPGIAAAHTSGSKGRLRHQTSHLRHAGSIFCPIGPVWCFSKHIASAVDCSERGFCRCLHQRPRLRHAKKHQIPLLRQKFLEDVRNEPFGATGLRGGRRRGLPGGEAGYPAGDRQWELPGEPLAGAAREAAWRGLPGAARRAPRGAVGGGCPCLSEKGCLVLRRTLGGRMRLLRRCEGARRRPTQRGLRPGGSRESG